MPKKLTSKFPCGFCKSNCVSDCVLCSVCDNWYHAECQNISADELKCWGELDKNFVCVVCRSNDDGEFDYLMGMHRLQQAARTKNLDNLKAAVQREKLFKVQMSVNDCKPNYEESSTDKVAASIMERYAESGRPVATSGNGDCLFNAVSILLVGNEQYSLCLRYQTCMEMVENWDFYLNHPNRKDIQCLSPSLTSATLDCAKIGGYSSAWTIMALAEVIKRPINVLYPPFNGINDPAHRALNKVFNCSKPTANLNPINILWYCMNTEPVPGKWYNVNHFAAIVDEKDKSTSSLKRKPVFTESWEKPKRKRLSASSILSEEAEVSVRNKFECLSSSDSDNSESAEDADDVQSPIFHSSPINTNPKKKLKTRSPKRETSNMKSAPVKGKFMTNDNIISILTNTVTAEKSIPNGTKEDVYVVVESGDRGDFPDDCGVWDSKSGTTVNQTFEVTQNNHLKSVYKRNDKYCIKKVENKKLIYKPLQPQPTNIITIHRYYTTLKQNSNFKKRVTKLIETPPYLSEKQKFALVEYSGHKTQNQNIPHGNSKSKEPYTRTDPKILHKAYEQSQSKKASEIYLDMIEDNSMLAPKSTRQIQDKIHREKKKNMQYTSQRNIADELLDTISQLHTNPCIQEIILTKDKQPSVIIYTKEQLEDLKKNCIGEHGSILGVDRTFNLGKCYVTSFSYKNLSVINRKTKEFPIMLGPLLIHWDGEQSTYNKFFSHIRDVIGTGHITIGSDEEKAMTNAIHDNFSASTTHLCTKHLKDNIRRHLQKHGTEQKDREQIIKIIFNRTNGLVFSDNDIEYSTRQEDLKPFFAKSSKFQKYWDNYIEKRIRHYVYEPLKNKHITQLWTNNNSESINHRLKQAADWKQHNLPQLIEKLSTVSRTQVIDIRRTLYGLGNYQLTNSAKHHKIEYRHWQEKSNKEKSKLFWNFLKDKKSLEKNNITVEEKFVISSRLKQFKTLKLRTNVGKKPGQRKRPKAERTTTYK